MRRLATDSLLAGGRWALLAEIEVVGVVHSHPLGRKAPYRRTWKRCPDFFQLYFEYS